MSHNLPPLPPPPPPEPADDGGGKLPAKFVNRAKRLLKNMIQQSKSLEYSSMASRRVPSTADRATQTEGRCACSSRNLLRIENLLDRIEGQVGLGVRAGARGTPGAKLFQTALRGVKENHRRADVKNGRVHNALGTGDEYVEGTSIEKASGKREEKSFDSVSPGRKRKRSHSSRDNGKRHKDRKYKKHSNRCHGPGHSDSSSENDSVSENTDHSADRSCRKKSRKSKKSKKDKHSKEKKRSRRDGTSATPSEEESKKRKKHKKKKVHNGERKTRRDLPRNSDKSYKSSQKIVCPKLSFSPLCDEDLENVELTAISPKMAVADTNNGREISLRLTGKKKICGIWSDAESSDGADVKAKGSGENSPKRETVSNCDEQTPEGCAQKMKDSPKNYRSNSKDLNGGTKDRSGMFAKGSTKRKGSPDEGKLKSFRPAGTEEKVPTSRKSTSSERSAANPVKGGGDKASSPQSSSSGSPSSAEDCLITSRLSRSRRVVKNGYAKVLQHSETSDVKEITPLSLQKTTLERRSSSSPDCARIRRLLSTNKRTSSPNGSPDPKGDTFGGTAAKNCHLSAKMSSLNHISPSGSRSSRSGSGSRSSAKDQPGKPELSKWERNDELPAAYRSEENGGRQSPATSRSRSRSSRSRSRSQSGSYRSGRSRSDSKGRSTSRRSTSRRSDSRRRSYSRSTYSSRSRSGSRRYSSRSRSRSSRSRSHTRSRSPSIPRRAGSPSFLDKRRITRAPDAKYRHRRRRRYSSPSSRSSSSSRSRSRSSYSRSSWSSDYRR